MTAPTPAPRPLAPPPMPPMGAIPLVGEKPLVGARPLLASGRRSNPYVGPRAFRNGEKLFGRGHETDALLSLLLAERIVVLHSQSGAGKTSLLQANLIPRLIEEGFDILPPARVSRLPAEAPKGQVCRYALSTLIDWESERKDPRSPEELVHYELDAYLAERSRQRPDAPQVIIFDQFEELLTLDATDVDAKREFCRQAGIVLQNRMRWAIVAMREEFIGALDPFLDYFPTRLASRSRLELLSPDAAQASIAGPAESAGVKFSPEAVERLVSDLRKVRQQVSATAVDERDGPFIEPVQLQVVCTRLWENLPADATVVTAERVVDVGNVDEALGGYYATAVARAAAAGGCQEGDVRRWIETALVVNRVRAQVLQGSEAAHNVSADAVKALEDAYVVRREERRGGIWFELAHDRLVTPVLKDNARWRDESMSDIEKLAARWIAEGRPNRLLAAVVDPKTLQSLLQLQRRAKQGEHANAEVREYVIAARKYVFLRAALLYGGAALLAIGVVVWQRERSFETEKEHLQQDAQREAAESRSLRAKSESLRVKSESLQLVVDSINRLRATVFDGWGLEQATPTLVSQSVAADQALQTLTKATPRGDRAPVAIEYYYKRRDPERVEYVLRGLGYRVSVEQARAEEVATNALSYGSAVPLTDVRIIALALARAGAQLKRICPFRESGGRAHIVQVIGSSISDQYRPLSVKDLEAIGPTAPPPCPSGPALAR